MSNILLDTLKKQPLICAEGYLFEMERRGYLTSGEFVPEVALEHPEVLENAGADEADMIIAVSDNDESNIISCELANHLFKIPLKVARIKESAYLEPKYLEHFFSNSITFFPP